MGQARVALGFHTPLNLKGTAGPSAVVMRMVQMSIHDLGRSATAACQVVRAQMVAATASLILKGAATRGAELARMLNTMLIGPAHVLARDRGRGSEANRASAYFLQVSALLLE